MTHLRSLIRNVFLAIAAPLALWSAAARAQETAKSPDGADIVSIVPAGEGYENGTGTQALLLQGVETGVQRRLLVSKWSGDYRRNLTGLSRPLFSLDGNYVYFSSSDASPNSGYVHRFDLGRSNLTSNETWQEALSDVVQRHGSVYGAWVPLDAGQILGDGE